MPMKGFELLLISTLLLVGCETKKGGVVVNTPPEIKDVSIYPDQPTSQTRAQAIVKSKDREGDPIGYTVKWFVNGKETAEGIEYSCSDIRRDDIMYVLVTPSDGKASGKTVKSKAVTAGNIPPRIISAEFEPETLFATTRNVKINIQAEDKDGDVMRFICRWHMGSRLLSDSSISISGLDLKKGDRFTVDVFASDGESLSLGYVLNGTVSNSPPVLGTKMDSVMMPADSFVYSLPFSDPDGDQLSYSLSQAPLTVKIDPRTGQISGKIEQPSPIVVRVTDAEGSYLDVRFILNPAR